MKPQGFVTISIDDGHPSDLLAADLLRRHGLKATFYIPARNSEREVMPKAQIRDLSRDFEIGAHTFSHVQLTCLSQDHAMAQINDGKQWLEDLLGQAVISFCYPRGKFTQGTIALVKKAGFLGARTCMFNLNRFPKNPFCWGVSTQAYSHSRYIQVRHAVLEGNLQGLWLFFVGFKGRTDWLQRFTYALQHVSQYGGIAHLYLHSWEIQKFGQWDKLEAAFRSTSDFPHLTRVTNGDLFRLWTPREIPRQNFLPRL